MSRVLFPRLHLAEIEDQPWCPSWLREHSHLALTRMWGTALSKKGSPAQQAAEILLRAVGGPDEASKYTFVDSCAGAGGPTPLLEQTMNETLHAHGHAPVRFVLTDLWPDLKAWRAIARRSQNISYIEKPTDATTAVRLAGPGRKECRVFNLCFHHFDDAAGEKVLRSAVESADAFVYVNTEIFEVTRSSDMGPLRSQARSIFEMTHRTLPSLLNTTIVVLSPLITTLFDFWWSPLHLFFTYLLPIVPLFYAVDGYVSCTRGRTADETFDLIRRQPGVDLGGWEFRSGEQLVIPLFGVLYWYSGVKKDAKA